MKQFLALANGNICQRRVNQCNYFVKVLQKTLSYSKNKILSKDYHSLCVGYFCVVFVLQNNSENGDTWKLKPKTNFFSWFESFCLSINEL